MKNTAHPNKGFTLLEITIVLVLIGVVTAGGLVVFGASLQKSQADATVAKMTAIEKALLNYRVAFGRIPCPASLAMLPPTPAAPSANYGIEAAVPGTCTGGTPAAEYSVSNVAEGAIPTRALQLPDDYMYDGWGRHMRYAVDVTMTATGAFTAYPLKPTTLTTGPLTCPHGGITIYDSSASAATPRTANAIYALISHGANGHGAYTQNNAVVNAASSNANELINCHCNTSGVSIGYPPSPLTVPTYVQQIPTYQAGHLGVTQWYFDDIVAFKERFQLVTPNEPSVAPTCP
jgi:prepilin-type N-terminal cleavage/methylation domain-containing protein